MLKKNNVEDFYEKILVTHKLFEVVHKKNKSFESQHYADNPQLKIEFQKKEQVTKMLPQLTDPAEKYIVSNISDSGIKKIAINLFSEMDKYSFHKTSSVPKNRESVLRDSLTRYDLLSKIKLDNHTIYCAISAIEVCEKNDVPSSIKDLVIILAICHDFGKEPEIFRKYKNKQDDLHNVVSAYYVKKTFRKYISKEIHQDTYKQLIYTLYHHHKPPSTSKLYNPNEKKDSFLIKLLNEADHLAREKEQIFLESSEL